MTWEQPWDRGCSLQVECTEDMAGRLLAEDFRVRVEPDPGKVCAVSEQLDSQTGSPGNIPSGSWYASWAWHWEALHTGVPPLPCSGAVHCSPRCDHYNCGRRGHLCGMKGHLLMKPEWDRLIWMGHPFKKEPKIKKVSSLTN